MPIKGITKDKLEINKTSNHLLRANYRYIYDKSIKENLYDYIQMLINRFKKLYSVGYEIYSSSTMFNNDEIEIIIGVISIAEKETCPWKKN